METDEVVLRVRCDNCNHIETEEQAAPTVRDDVGRVTLAVGQKLEMMCWDCGCTQMHLVEEEGAPVPEITPYEWS